MTDTTQPPHLDFLSEIVNVQWGNVYVYLEATATGLAGFPSPFKASATAINGGKPIASNIQVTQSGGVPQFTGRFIFKTGFSAKPVIRLTLGGENILTNAGGHFVTFGDVNFYLVVTKNHKIASIANLNIDPPFNPSDSIWEGDFFSFSTDARPLNQTYTFTVNKIPYLKSDPKGQKSKIQVCWPNIPYNAIYSSLTSDGPDVRAKDFAAGHNPWPSPRTGQLPPTVS